MTQNTDNMTQTMQTDIIDIQNLMLLGIISYDKHTKLFTSDFSDLKAAGHDPLVGSLREAKIFYRMFNSKSSQYSNFVYHKTLRDSDGYPEIFIYKNENNIEFHVFND